MDNLTASSNFFSRFSPKWIFIILGAVVLIELVVGIRVLTESNVSFSKPPVTLAPSKGKIALSSSQEIVNIGDSFAVIIEVSSPLPSVGVDIVASFDPKALQASDSDISKGTIYPQFPIAKIEEGLIRISGITTSGGKGFSGTGYLAVINFKAIKAGKTSVSLDYTKGSTADSNIVSETSSKDLLEEVQNLEITVQ